MNNNNFRNILKKGIWGNDYSWWDKT